MLLLSVGKTGYLFLFHYSSLVSPFLQRWAAPENVPEMSGSLVFLSCTVHTNTAGHSPPKACGSFALNRSRNCGIPDRPDSFAFPQTYNSGTKGQIPPDTALGILLLSGHTVHNTPEYLSAYRFLGDYDTYPATVRCTPEGR